MYGADFVHVEIPSGFTHGILILNENHRTQRVKALFAREQGAMSNNKQRE